MFGLEEFVDVEASVLEEATKRKEQLLRAFQAAAQSAFAETKQQAESLVQQHKAEKERLEKCKRRKCTDGSFSSAGNPPQTNAASSASNAAASAVHDDALDGKSADALQQQARIAELKSQAMANAKGAMASRS